MEDEILSKVIQEISQNHRKMIDGEWMHLPKPRQD